MNIISENLHDPATTFDRALHNLDFVVCNVNISAVSVCQVPGWVPVVWVPMAAGPPGAPAGPSSAVPSVTGVGHPNAPRPIHGEHSRVASPRNERVPSPPPPYSPGQNPVARSSSSSSSDRSLDFSPRSSKGRRRIYLRKGLLEVKNRFRLVSSPSCYYSHQPHSAGWRHGRKRVIT